MFCTGDGGGEEELTLACQQNLANLHQAVAAGGRGGESYSVLVQYPGNPRLCHSRRIVDFILEIIDYGGSNRCKVTVCHTTQEWYPCPLPSTPIESAAVHHVYLRL